MRGRIDWIFFWLVGALLLLGLVVLTSASSVVSLRSHDTAFYFVFRQLVLGVFGGLALLLFFALFPFRRFRKISWPFFGFSLLLSLLVFLPQFGVASGGARRWLNLFGFSFQPSELLKLSFIILLSALMAKGVNFLLFSGLSAVVASVLILQSDLGTMILILMVACLIFFVAGANWQQMAFIVLSGFLSIALFIKIAPYRLNRLLVYLNPRAEPRGIGYQIKQALVALGSGGLWGVGLGHSTQKYSYLPATINDSIFAIIGEEFGLVGTSLVVVLFLFLAWRGLKIAAKTGDKFSRLLALGITAWLTLQAFINIMGITSLLPLTGIPLPFVSYGASSMIASLAGVGILLNISKQ